VPCVTRTTMRQATDWTQRDDDVHTKPHVTLTSDLWPWPLIYDLEIQYGSRGCQGTCACKIPPSQVQRFMSYQQCTDFWPMLKTTLPSLAQAVKTAVYYQCLVQAQCSHLTLCSVLVLRVVRKWRVESILTTQQRSSLQHTAINQSVNK